MIACRFDQPRSGSRLFIAPSLLIAHLLVLAGCEREEGDRNPEPLVTSAPEATMAVDFASQLNVDVTQMEDVSGVLRRDLELGEGIFATPGDVVTVHYTGWLADGKQFDSSRGKSPYQFPLGAGTVIEGWDIGVAGMREGGKRQLVIPPHLGYGQMGAGGVIPPNATLVFEVELMKVN